jgi:hypothetical protein
VPVWPLRGNSGFSRTRPGDQSIASLSCKAQFDDLKACIRGGPRCLVTGNAKSTAHVIDDIDRVAELIWENEGGRLRDLPPDRSCHEIE